MLTRRALAIARISSSRRPVRFKRWLNQGAQGPHTTYFQQPPTPMQSTKRSTRRLWLIPVGTLLTAASFGFGFLIGAAAVAVDLESVALDTLSHDHAKALAALAMVAGVTLQDLQAFDCASRPGPISPEYVSLALQMGMKIACDHTLIAHAMTLGSNCPNEDHYSVNGMRDQDLKPSINIFGVYDGHAGARLSTVVSEHLPLLIMENLSKLDARTGNAYTDEDVKSCLASTFEELDAEFLHAARQIHGMSNADERDQWVARLADEGSCALVACYDVPRSKVYIANTGDSRAVRGSWDAQQGRYVAIPMSVDQTGFNKNEVDRLQKEHPGEPVIDEKTGRIFGLAVTRAFGDMRWKLPEEVISSLHQRLLVSPPRPGSVVKTPPYLTARPEVSCFEPKLGDKPDFLILATDGLWDQLSSDQAVDLVQRWLDSHKPKDLILQPGEKYTMPKIDNVPFETYYDAKTKTQKWHNSEEYFTTKDAHCGMHLVRNALGGNRDGLLSATLALPPHRSRDVRDDITATVIFFGADTTGIEPELLSPERQPFEGLWSRDRKR